MLGMERSACPRYRNPSPSATPHDARPRGPGWAGLAARSSSLSVPRHPAADQRSATVISLQLFNLPAVAVAARNRVDEYGARLIRCSFCSRAVSTGMPATSRSRRGDDAGGYAGPDGWPPRPLYHLAAASIPRPSPPALCKREDCRPVVGEEIAEGGGPAVVLEGVGERGAHHLQDGASR